jgi:NitT/TauT family transport system substrate-binding protein
VRTRNRLVTLAVAMLLLTGCADDGETPATEQESTPEDTNDEGDTSATAAEVCDPSEPRHLNISTATIGFLYVPFYVADGAGFLEERGITYDRLVSAQGNTPALLSGDSDIIEAAFTTTFALRNEGRDVVAIGSYVTDFASNVVAKSATLEERGVDVETATFEERARALEGMRIGITSPGLGPDVLVRGILQEVGLDPDRDAEIIALGDGGSMLSAFEQNRIDAFSLSSPTATTAILEFDGEMLFNPTLGDYPTVDDILYVALLTRESWLEDPDNRDLAGCFLQAIDEALKLIDEDPDRALELARDAFDDIDEEVYRQAFEESVNGYPTSVAVETHNAQIAYDFDRQFRTVEGELEEHIDNSLYEEYVAGAGS